MCAHHSSADGITGPGTRRGFTLVELLVVIGIISLLISMLMPALTRARDAAVTTQCMSNMRQDGLAVNMYQSDNHGFLPPYRIPAKYKGYSSYPYFWQYLPALYQTQSSKSFICPADNLVLSVEGSTRGGWPELQSGTPDLAYSYAQNFEAPQGVKALYHLAFAAGPPDWYNPWLGMKVAAPSEMMVLMETAENALQGHSSPSFFFRFNHRNNKAMNILYMDGHVETLTAKQFLPQGALPGDQAYWPDGFRAFWFGRGDLNGQLLE